MLIAFGLMAVGYIGLFFGRWIKAAVSRQREYLADASAVQFTRDPEGISGALKKIAVYSDASYLDADSEEISHMLFGDGRKMMMFSTHPPLNQRISRVEPGFQPEELVTLAARIEREHIRAAEEESRPKKESNRKPGFLDTQGIIDGIGNPDWERLLMAAAVASSIPDSISQAAHSTEWAPEVLFYSLLDSNAEVREKQLLAVAGKMGGESEAQVSALIRAAGLPAAEQQLPLLEIAFPALKRRPPDFVTRVLATVSAMIEADGRIDVFEYLLARVISMHLWESQNPHRVRGSGNKSISTCHAHATALLAVLARHGSSDTSAAIEAYSAGLAALDLPASSAMPDTEDWVKALDAALPELDLLKPVAKEKLVRAMAAVVLHDEQLAITELELLRVSCELIHVPLPMLTAAPQTSQRS